MMAIKIVCVYAGCNRGHKRLEITHTVCTKSYHIGNLTSIIIPFVISHTF